MTPILESRSPWSAMLGFLRTFRAEAEPPELAAAAVAVLGLLIALVSPAEPTGSAVGDVLARVAFVALLGSCAVLARTWTWAAFAALAFGAGLASGVWLALVGVVAVVPALIAALTPTRSLVLPVAAVSFGSAVLLRLDSDSSLPATALLGLAAVPMVASAYRRIPSAWRTTVAGVAGVAGAVCLIWTALFAGALLGARGDLEAGVDAAERGVDATRAGDRGLAASELDLAARYFRRANGSLDRPWLRPVRMLPFVGIQANAVVQASATGEDVADASAVAAGEADLDRLKLDGGRIALDEVQALREPVVEVAAELAAASATVDSLDSPWLLAPLRSQLDELAGEVESAAADAELAADVLEVLPAILGADGERRYLIAFLNPSETRGQGGFMGSYAELSADAGQVSMTRSGNTFLDFTEDPASATWSISGPPEYLERYGPFQPERFLHDVPYSPDFPTNATVLAELYPQATGTDIDGVISIDPYALAALLEFTGPISVAGLDEPLTERNAPQVLLADQYLQFDDFEQQRGRRQALDQVTEIAFSRLLSGDLPAPSALAEALSPAVREDRLMLFSEFEAEQALFAETGIDGAFERRRDGDVFSLISQNSGNNKIDTFLYRTVDYSVTHDRSSGDAAATATIELVNEAPAEGLPVYVLGNSLDRPRGTNIAYVSVYSPLDLVDATMNGQPMSLTSERELGLNVFSGFVEMPPKGSTTLVLNLAGRLQPGERYTLDYLSQPIVHPDAVTVAVTTSGATREQSFLSVSDELLTFG